MIQSYLESPARPERSLKAIAGLFGLSSYEAGVADGLLTYPSPSDPALLRYNALDCLTARHLYDLLATRMRDNYGPDCEQLSPYCINWYSKLIWLLIDMTENGVTFSKPALESLHTTYDDACRTLYQKTLTTWNGAIEGHESVAFANLAVEEAAKEAGLYGSKRLVISEVKKRVSTCKANVNLILSKLPDSSPYHELLTDIRSFRKNAKLRNTYIANLLSDGHTTPRDVGSLIWRGTRTGEVIGVAHPDWFATPSTTGRGDSDDDKEGGTKQGRVTCRRPGLQTNPSDIRKTMTCRFRPGYLIHVDLSHIELRVLAILSGDPTLVSVFTEGRDPHLETAKGIFGPIIPNGLTPERYRYIGKKVNFLIVYGGEASILRKSLTEEANFPISKAKAQEFISRYAATYPILWKWRESVIQEAGRTGYVRLPLTGTSRYVPGASTYNRETLGKVVMNIFPQAIAANILLSAASLLLEEFHSHNLLASCGLQTYDSLDIETPEGEHEMVINLIEHSILHAPYYRDICKLSGRSVPLHYKKEETLY
ncbi:DNA polymerase [Candidatus Magnetobacterium casense]|uniref:DNA polymerase n=1 Tax=Candidatus Magnetobacterium casense TaxID=1455061 RepID=UPI001C4751CE|nr:DNA polymerase [Candidatus Magnetobacterium casensis]